MLPPGVAAASRLAHMPRVIHRDAGVKTPVLYYSIWALRWPSASYSPPSMTATYSVFRSRRVWPWKARRGSGGRWRSIVFGSSSNRSASMRRVRLRKLEEIPTTRDHLCFLCRFALGGWWTRSCANGRGGKVVKASTWEWRFPGRA